MLDGLLYDYRFPVMADHIGSSIPGDRIPAFLFEEGKEQAYGLAGCERPATANRREGRVGA